MKFENYIFDYGNVLYMFESDDILFMYTDSKEEVQILKEEIFKDWASLDNGSIDYYDYIDTVQGNLKEDLKQTAHTVLTTWHKAIPQVNGMIELLKDLKEKNHKLYLLSNAPTRLEEVFDEYPESKYFDGIVISGSVKLVKPDIAIYEYITNKFNIDKEKTLFIDDRQANIDGAKEFGLHTYLFDGDAKKLRNFLEI